MSSHLPDPAAGTPSTEWSQDLVNALISPNANATAEPSKADPTQTSNPQVFDPAAAKTTPAAPLAAPSPLASATAAPVGASTHTPVGSGLGSALPPAGAASTHTPVGSGLPPVGVVAQAPVGSALPPAGVATHNPVGSALPPSVGSSLPAVGQTTHASIGSTLPPVGETTHATIGSTDAPHTSTGYNPSQTTSERLAGAGLSSGVPDTPGPAVPGAFPRTLSDEGRPTVAQTAAQLQAQAAPYIATLQESLGKAAQNAAQYLPQSMKEQVAPYLPEGTHVTSTASHNDTVHATSYPSTELVGGGGALPGVAGETGVAILPEERLAEQTGTAPVAPGIAQRAAGYLPQSVKETVAPYLPAGVLAATTATASDHDTTHTTSLPSTELTGAGSEHVGGVGALPGTANESGVAKLLDERAPHESTHTTAGNVAAGRESVATNATAGRDYAVNSLSAGSAYVIGAAATAAAAVNRGAEYVGVKASEATQSAKETVAGGAQPGSAGALVNTSTAVAPHETHSLPTTEVEGARPGEHVGGVGALPGGKDEAGVAALPKGDFGGPTTTTTTSSHSGSHTGALLGAGALAGVGAASLPTHEKEDAREHERVGGVGALPGSKDEAGVAALPKGDFGGPITTTTPHTGLHADSPKDSHTGSLGAGALAGAGAASLPTTEKQGAREHDLAAPLATTGSNSGVSSGAPGATGAHAGVPSGAPASVPVDAGKRLDADKPTEAAVPKAAETTTKHQTSTTNDKPLPVKDDAYKTDYHPAAIHPADADYSGVKLSSEPEDAGGQENKPAGKSESTSQPSGLKEGGDRKVHGGVPGDVGGGTMPVGDKHEGGVDSTDPKGKAHTEESGVERKSTLKDKAKGFFHKVAHPKGDSH